MSLDIKTILGILLITALVALAVVRAFRQEADDDLRRTGRVAMAEIVSVTNTGVRFRHGPEVAITVRFQDGTGSRVVTFKETASVSSMARLQPGVHTEIVYDPARPDRVALRAP